jgi:hypothetical protein
VTGRAWVEQWHYDIVDVASLPRVGRLDGPPCMARPAWRRLSGRSTARRRGCCWYHGVDWLTVNETALRLIADALAAAVPIEDIAGRVVEQARIEGLPGDDIDGHISTCGNALRLTLSQDLYPVGQARRG